MALDLVAPGRAVGVLEVGHEALGAGVQRVDDQLAVGRPGDLDPPVGVVGAGRRDLPVPVADRPRSRPGSRPGAGAARAGRPAAPAGGRRSGRCRSATKSSAAADEHLGVARARSASGRGRTVRRRSQAATPRIDMVEQGHRVQHRHRARSAGGRRSAARSPGWPRRSTSAPVAAQVAALRWPSLAAGLRLGQVVDAGRAAAQLPLGAARPGSAPGCRAAGRAAAAGRPGRGPDGRRRGRPRVSSTGAGRPAARARPATRARRAPWPRTRAARSAQAGSSASRRP